MSAPPSGSAGGRAARGQARERLLDAAATLIPELGWGHVSSRLVAERAGVSLGVVHYHFATIGELRREAAVRNTGRLFGEVVARLEQPEERQEASVGSQLVRQIMAAVSVGDAHRPELVLLYEGFVAATRDEALRNNQAEVIREFRARLAARLGELGLADPTGVAATFAAAIDGYLLQRALQPDLAADDVTRGLVTLVEEAERAARV